MTHTGTQTIRTSRLTLRRFSVDDAIKMYENWAGDPAVTEYLSWPTHADANASARVLGLWVACYEKPDYYQWAIVPNDLAEPIGSIAVVSLDEATQCIQIGYCIGKTWWHRGYTSEALSALIDFFFASVGVNRIEAKHDPDNTHSGNVMQKCGMTCEGTYRLAHKSNKGLRDARMYSILKEEWETRREIEAYRALPFEFHGFIDVPTLSDGTIYLVCTQKSPAIPEKHYVPSYTFAVCSGGEQIGGLNLRIGYSGFGPDFSSLYYGGQIGYHIDEKYRGHGYAAAACALVRTVARAHGMQKLLITNDVNNIASRRVCEKLALRHVRVARLPEWIELYKDGSRFVNIYEMDV